MYFFVQSSKTKVVTQSDMKNHTFCKTTSETFGQPHLLDV